VAGCCLQEEEEGSPQLLTKESSEGDCDSGQVFSVSMSWYSVPKGGGGKKSQEEKEIGLFCVSYFVLGLHHTILAFQWNGQE
jgi:hypothetical protein